jgi:ATP-dependent DNA helicase RecG
MTNGEGGAILIGVDDKAAGPAAFLGTGLDAPWLIKRIRELTNPKLTITPHETMANGQRLLALIVARNDGSVPIAAKVGRRGWRTARRLGTDCEEMDFTAQMAWVQSRQGYDWSAQSSGKQHVEIRPQALDAIRDFLRESGEPDRAALAGLGDIDLIARLQLVHDDETLNNAGALLSCPSAEIRLKYLARPAPGAVSSTRLESSGRGLAEICAGFSRPSNCTIRRSRSKGEASPSARFTRWRLLRSARGWSTRSCIVTGTSWPRWTSIRWAVKWSSSLPAASGAGSPRDRS